MSHKETNRLDWPARLLIIVLAPLGVLVLLPLVVVVLLTWLLATIGLNILVWMAWCSRGRDILFVYSDSPIWRDYFEKQIIPEIASRAVILNYSDRRHWLHRCWLSSLVFRFFGGSSEYNPLAVYFRPFRRHRTFRFWQAFKDSKHGKTNRLEQLQSEFFHCIGQPRQHQEQVD